MFQKVPAPDRLTRKVKTVLAQTSHRLAALGSVFVLLLPHDEGIHTNVISKRRLGDGSPRCATLRRDAGNSTSSLNSRRCSMSTM